MLALPNEICNICKNSIQTISIFRKIITKQCRVTMKKAPNFLQPIPRNSQPGPVWKSMPVHKEENKNQDIFLNRLLNRDLNHTGFTKMYIKHFWQKHTTKYLLLMVYRLSFDAFYVHNPYQRIKQPTLKENKSLEFFVFFFLYVSFCLSVTQCRATSESKCKIHKKQEK